MKYTDVFYYDSDNLVLLEGPVNEVTGAAITNTPAVTAAKCRVFNDAKETFLSAGEATAETVLSVEDPSRFEVNIDQVVIWLNDGTWHEGGFVTARDLDAGTITVTTGLASGSGVGNRVCAIIGNLIGAGNPWEIDMTYYEPASGAVAGNFDYGWRVVLPDTMSAFGMDIGVVARCELVLDAAADVKVTKTIKRRVVGGI